MFFFICFDLTIREWQSEREVYTETLSRALFSAFMLSDAHVTLSIHLSTFTVECRIEKSFHRVITR